MRKLIVLLYLVPSLLFAASTSNWEIVQVELGTGRVNPQGTNMVIAEAEITNLVSETITLDGTRLYKASFGSGFLTNNTVQVLTAASGFQALTNFQPVASLNMSSLTHSSLTVNVDGWFQFSSHFSCRNSAAGTDLTLSVFTNNAYATNVVTREYFPTANKFGDFSAAGLVYLYSNDIVTIRVNTDKNTTLTFSHGDANLIRIGPE